MTQGVSNLLGVLHQKALGSPVGSIIIIDKYSHLQCISIKTPVCLFVVCLFVVCRLFGSRFLSGHAALAASDTKGRFTMPKTQRPATSDLLRDQSPRQLSIHNVHVLATSRPPRPWYLHDVAGRKSPSTKRK